MYSYNLRCVVLALSVTTALSAKAVASEPDPITADPVAFATRIQLSKGYAISKKGVEISVRARNEQSQDVSSETYHLVRSTDAAEFVLTVQDRARLAAQQAHILSWMDAGIDVDGAFSMQINPCHIDPPKANKARVSIAVRGDFESGFYKVVDEMRLSRLINKSIDTLEPCGTS